MYLGNQALRTISRNDIVNNSIYPVLLYPQMLSSQDMFLFVLCSFFCTEAYQCTRFCSNFTASTDYNSHPTHKSLDCGRKLEYPRGNHGYTYTRQTSKQRERSLWLTWGLNPCKPTMLTTKPTYHPIMLSPYISKLLARTLWRVTLCVPLHDLPSLCIFTTDILVFDLTSLPGFEFCVVHVVCFWLTPASSLIMILPRV